MSLFIPMVSPRFPGLMIGRLMSLANELMVASSPFSP